MNFELLFFGRPPMRSLSNTEIARQSVGKCQRYSGAAEGRRNSFGRGHSVACNADAASGN